MRSTPAGLLLRPLRGQGVPGGPAQGRPIEGPCRRPQAPRRCGCMRTLHRRIALLSCLALPVLAQPEALSGEETATCIAVMQHQAEAWAQQVRQGDRALEPTLLAELERAAALMGRSYLDGTRDEAEAKARLKAAQEAQANWPAERRLRQRLVCDSHADAEIARAGFAQKLLIQKVARSRLKRMLAPAP